MDNLEFTLGIADLRGLHETAIFGSGSHRPHKFSITIIPAIRLSNARLKIQIASPRYQDNLIVEMAANSRARGEGCGVAVGGQNTNVG